MKLWILMLMLLPVAVPAHAADEKSKGNAVERAGKATGKALDRAGNAVERTGKRVGKAVNRAADKTGEWIRKKTE